MVLQSQRFFIFIFLAQALFAPNEAESRRPIWNIAHMVNAVRQIDYYLDNGANGLEFDITFSTEGKAKFTFHGIPCDCFRSCIQYEDFATYLQYLRKLTTPGEPIFRKELVMLFLDFKVRGLSPNALTKAGEDVALKFLEYYWMRGNSEAKAFLIVSLPSTKHVGVFRSFRRTLQMQNASEYFPKIGLEFSGNENLYTIQNILESSGFHENNWLGDGITNCLGRSTKRLLTALRKRDEVDGKFSKVYWWTVDRKTTMRRVLRLGVDGLITNYPQNLFQILKEDAFRKEVRLATIEDNPFIKHPRATGRFNSFQEENSTFHDWLEEEEMLYNQIEDTSFLKQNY